jgi:serine/threonine protein kinase
VPALVFDYLGAQPLSTIIHQAQLEGYPASTDKALLIVAKLTQALAAGLTLERGGKPLVHGLLHPGMVTVTTDGEPVVAGFGVADALLDLLDHTEIADHLTPYLAPEVVLARTPSKSGDVYSLGAVLIELLTGEPLPPDPEKRAGVLDSRMVAHDERPIPEDIASLLRRAVAARPEDRYSSAVDLKKELDRLLHGGAYNPTTFHIALFLDRLFRSEIDAEDRQRAIDESLDVTPLLAAKSHKRIDQEDERASVSRRHTAWWFGAATLVVASAIAFGSWFAFIKRPPQPPPAPPTPTAEELAEQRLQQSEHLQQMVEELVQQKMADKEEEITRQLRECQESNEGLRRRVRELESRAGE